MKNINIKLPFALNENNVLVHIDDVESGKYCKCICPSCLSPLIAAKGTKIQHHFKHAVIKVCEGGLESAIHLAAKKIIMEKKQLTLPECSSIASAIDSKGVTHTTEPVMVVRQGTIISFDSVQEEKTLDKMKADILAIAGTRQLIIEIFYRHKVEAEKIGKIIQADISAIEVDLSNLSPEDVKNWDHFWLYINDPERIQWLYNSKVHNIIFPKLVNQLELQIQKIEMNYEYEEIIHKRNMQKERAKLVHAIEELKVLRSKEHIIRLAQDAEIHPSWKIYSQHLKLSFNNIHEFLYVDVPDGDWIFGSDKRVWQTAFYSYFICTYPKPFCIKEIDEWLNNIAMCRTPPSAKILELYGNRYPDLIPPNILGNLPSSWKTLEFYLDHLCELGILEFSQSTDDLAQKGNYWFKVVSKLPQTSYKFLVLERSTKLFLVDP